MKRLSSEKTICKFENGIKENYKIKAGDTVVVETCDCFHNQIVSEDQVLLEIDMDIVNPATGPVYIDGAEIGDILKVDILDIKVAEKGVVATIPDVGGLPNDSKESVLKILEVKNGYVNYLGKKIAINPMIGVIGVAPRKEDGSWGSETRWKYGY